MKLKLTQSRSTKFNEAINGVGWSNSESIISVSDNHQILQTNTTTQEVSQVTTLPQNVFPTSLHMFPRTFAKNMQNDIFAVTTSDGNIMIISKGGKSEKVVEAHRGAALLAKWNGDGTGLLSCGEDGCVKMWSRNGMLRSVLAQFATAVYAISWDGSSSNVLYCNADQCYIKSLTTQISPIKWKAHDGLVLCCEWNPTSNLIVTGGEENKFKVWDGYGQVLFSSSVHDYPITSVAWSPDGKLFTVGSHNILRLCDMAGWSYSLDRITGGTIGSMSWSQDSTQLAIGTASGILYHGHLVEKRVSYQDLEIVQSQKTVVEILYTGNQAAKERLETKERISRISVLYKHVVIVTSNNFYVFSSTNWNTPIIIENRDKMTVSLVVQCQKLFLVSDGLNIVIYNYEGRLLLETKPPGSGNLLVDNRKMDLSDDTITMRDKGDPNTIHFLDPATGKQQGNGKLTHTDEIVELTINQCGSINDRAVAFRDSTQTIFIAMVKTFGVGERVAKIGTNAEQLIFCDINNMLAGFGEGKLYVWPIPTIAFSDREVLQKSLLQKNVPNLGKFPQLVSFFGNTLIFQNGGLVHVAIKAIYYMLIQFTEQLKWDQAIRVCRSVNDDSMWALLAGIALLNGNLYAMEIAYAALQNEERVLMLVDASDSTDKSVIKSTQNLLSGKVSDGISILEKDGKLFQALMLNIQLFRWSKAYDIALKNRKFLEIFMGYRDKYLKNTRQAETDPRYAKHMAEIEIDWIHIREIMADEYDKL